MVETINHHGRNGDKTENILLQECDTLERCWIRAHQQDPLMLWLAQCVLGHKSFLFKKQCWLFGSKFLILIYFHTGSVEVWAFWSPEFHLWWRHRTRQAPSSSQLQEVSGVEPLKHWWKVYWDLSGRTMVPIVSRILVLWLHIVGIGI